MTQEYDDTSICDRCEMEVSTLVIWNDQELCVKCFAYRQSDARTSAPCRRCGQIFSKFRMRCMDAGDAATEWFICETCNQSGDYDA